MLAFVDESGNTGDKALVGSSDYFVVAIVVFQNDEDAFTCSSAIEQLRHEHSRPASYEFHYAENSLKVKEAFLRRVAALPFSYYIFAIDKDPVSLIGTGLHRRSQYGKELYKFSVLKAIESVEPYLRDANVIIDESGGRNFRRELVTYLRQNLRDETAERSIKRIRTQDSKGSNLLQLADYVAGIVNRSLQGKQRESNFLHRYLMPHEAGRRLWAGENTNDD